MIIWVELSMLGIVLFVLSLFVIIDRYITTKRLEINQREWDKFSKNMSDKEKRAIFFEWLTENQIKHNWGCLYIPQNNPLIQLNTAKWIWFEYYVDDNYYNSYSCSNCGEISKEEEECCPKCKAKMIETIY